LSRTDADTKFARLKWRRAFDNWERKAARWVEAIKSGFDPNQPRVPAGNSDGGQWTGGGGSGGGGSNPDEGRVLSDATPDNLLKPGVRLAQADGKPPKIKLPKTGKPSRSGQPQVPPPQFPKQKPPTHKERLGHARTAARWLTIAVAGRYIRAGLLVARAIEETDWMDEFRGFIQSAYDPPKSLRQLQKDAFEPAPGYDIHHIVEKKAAKNAGFPTSMINAPENLVRIPRIRHWEITAWYARKNKRFNDLPPRKYLSDKSWEKQMEIGLEALRKYGVLKR